MFAIQAKKREKKGGAEVLRRAGELPAVCYGAGRLPISISVPFPAFKKLWREAGESSTVKVSVGEEVFDALIHDVQVDPVTSEPIHADFLAVDMMKKIRVSVPLEFVGVSEAVKNGLGNLVKVMHEIEVEAMPGDLPHELEADISVLKSLDDVITISQIKLPKGVTAMSSPEEIVASIVAQEEEKEEAMPTDLSSIVISEERGKKRKEGEGEEAGESTGKTEEEEKKS